ncbi:MAG: hypothetical protein V4487_08095 [Chlamydiota bacterium]
MLIFSFFLSLTALFLQATLFPSLNLLPFAPWIALVILRCNLGSALSLSSAAGVLMDLLSDDPIGLHALNYSITTALLYGYRKHFLFDVPLHLSLSTALVSALSTFLQLILLFLFDRRVPFSGKWILVDLGAMPVLDALYALVWFAAPLALFVTLRRIWVVFWLKRKNPSLASH